MPKKKEPPLSAAEQRKRFEALARESGARQNADQFRQTLRRVAGPVGKAAIKKK